MGRILRTALALLFVFAFAGVALADDEAPKDLKELSAKDLYKQECKNCHAPDSEWGEYSPMSLIGEQWEEFFDEYYVEAHEDVLTADENDGDKKVIDIFDEELLKKLRKFCIDHAADSEQPMTCG